MAMPGAHADAIRRANEQGYFPTPKQAKEIALVAAEEYAARYAGKPPRGPIDDRVFNETLGVAIRRVMEGLAPQQFEGVADAVLLKQVSEAMIAAQGKRIRVRIDHL